MTGSVMAFSCLMREGMVWMEPPLAVKTGKHTRTSVQAQKYTHKHPGVDGILTLTTDR